MRKTTRFLLLTTFLFSSSLPAEHLPRWELGASMVLMNLPDYRGSAEHTNYLLPAPFFSYRGERLRVDRGVIRGMLLDTDRATLDISIYATPPVESKSNAARRGMDNLNLTLEVGPSLEVLLFESANQKTRFDLNLPLRAAIATDFTQLNQQGWILFPHVDLLRRHRPGGQETRFELSFGPIFATKAYHQYYYGVGVGDATAERPTYDARPGYSGTRGIMTYRRYLSDTWVLRAFMQYDNLSGSAIDDSPLVTDKVHWLGGVMLTWMFARSKESVPYDFD